MAFASFGAFLLAQNRSILTVFARQNFGSLPIFAVFISLNQRRTRTAVFFFSLLLDSMYPYLTIFMGGTHATPHPKKTWNDADIDAVLAASSSSSPEKIPFTAQNDAGKHPADNLPIFGYADRSTLRKTTVNGVSALQIQPCEFAEGLLEKLRDTPLNKMSIRLDAATQALEHICFVERPAVKDLPPLTNYDFAAQAGKQWIDLSAAPVDFGDSRMPFVGDKLRSLRDWFIGKFGVDEANKAIPNHGLDDMTQWEPEIPQYFREYVDELRERIATLEKKAGIQKKTMVLDDDYDFSQSHTHNSTGEKMKELEELRQQQAQQKADFSAYQEAAAKRETELAAQNAALQKQLTEMRDKATEKENADFCDALIREGKILPVERDLALQDLNLAAKSEQKINFSGAEKSMLEAKKEILSQRPVIAPLGGHIARTDNAQAGNKNGKMDFSLDTDEGRNAIAAAAKQRAEEKKISFAAAVDEIIGEGAVA